ncbi:MAG: hypothetical protein AAB373_00045 [Patescibacteria group bacterium]
MSDVYYKLLERRQKLQLKTYGLLCLILLISMGFYSYKNWNEYALAKEGVKQNANFIEVLRKQDTEVKTTYESKVTYFSQLQREISKNLEMIFPTKDDYTSLTRQLDAFEENLSKKSDLFEVSNIDFQTPQVKDNSSVLPFKMSIRSSKENFTKFLHMVESSGALNSNIRLMDISSIKLNFENSSEESDANDLISFTVYINAYFQK